MNPKLQEWIDSSLEHNFIVGHPWKPDVTGVPVFCEMCGVEICLFPASAAKLGPLVHAICRAKCYPEMVRNVRDLQFGGHITGNVLPEALEKL